MKIGILGGSFNLAHHGHLHISNIAIKKLHLNQLWWIPTAYNPLKDRAAYQDYQKRLQSCQQIIANHPKIRLKDFQQVYTIDLVRFLQKKYKNCQFIWIGGADNLQNLHRWRDYKKLLKLLPFLIVSRETFTNGIGQTKAFMNYKQIRNYQVGDHSLPKLRVIRTRNLDISSTMINKSC